MKTRTKVSLILTNIFLVYGIVAGIRSFHEFMDNITSDAIQSDGLGQILNLIAWTGGPVIGVILFLLNIALMLIPIGLTWIVWGILTVIDKHKQKVAIGNADKIGDVAEFDNKEEL